MLSRIGTLAVIAATAFAQGGSDEEPAINYMDYANEEDPSRDPVCFLGGDREISDTEWPEPLCCRIYELHDFKGKYMDFCLHNRQTQKQVVDPFTELYGYHNWNDNASSWKCGRQVAAKFCYDAVTEDCNDGAAESGSPGAQNPVMKPNNALTTVILFGKSRPTGTLFDEPGCQGLSHRLDFEWADELE